MGANVSEQGEPQKATATDKSTGRVAQVVGDLREGFKQLRWGLVALLGLAAGVLMPLVITQGELVSFAAGIIPVGAGLLIGRRAKSHYTLHGFMTGLIGAIIGVLVLGGLLYYTPIGATLAQRALEQGLPPEVASIGAQWTQLGGFIAFALIAFCSFGASMSGRTEERNRQMREELEARGGRLERPPTVRTADDIRGMSLPQFGSYVNGVFKKQGFAFKDYRFIDKDKHLDLWMEHEGEPWHLRLTVQDKVSPGTVESLSQDMKREQCRKGVVVTSTEFTPGAAKAVKSRPIVLIDGPTLYQIAEK